MYTVIHEFCDLMDKKHVYRVGDKFPRSGINVSEDRIKELSTARNRIGESLIVEQEDNPAPKRRGRKKKNDDAE